MTSDQESPASVPSPRVGTTYNIPPAPPDPASTDWFPVGPLRVGIEYRKVDPAALDEIYADTEHLDELHEKSPEGGFTDEGVSVHIVSDAEDHEFLRFDMFVDEPHYHYVDKAAGTNTIIMLDTVALGPVIPWTLGQLRGRLPQMLRHAGAAVADEITHEVADTVADTVETHLRTIGEYT
jgi:hypothetical protein